jgi:hypothetical protein
MGYILHHTIVVTSWRNESVEEAHAIAESLGLPVSGIVDGVINGQKSFFVAPDGSKEGWSESDKCDEARDALKSYMNGMIRAERWLDWAEIRLGGDDKVSEVLESSDRIEGGVR